MLPYALHHTQLLQIAKYERRFNAAGSGFTARSSGDGDGDGAAKVPALPWEEEEEDDEGGW